MFKKIIKYFQKASIKNISIEVNENKLNFKLDNLSLNALDKPDLIVKKFIISEKKSSKGEKESGILPFSFEGIDISISQHFITSVLNIALSQINLVDYLKFKIANSKLILKGALKKFISFPFYVELDINHVKNFLCVEFKSIWLMDILPVPTFTFNKLFNYLNKKIDLPFVAFEGNKIFVDFEKIEFFKNNRLKLQKIRFSDGFINLIIDIEI